MLVADPGRRRVWEVGRDGRLIPIAGSGRPDPLPVAWDPADRAVRAALDTDLQGPRCLAVMPGQDVLLLDGGERMFQLSERGGLDWIAGGGARSGVRLNDLTLTYPARHTHLDGVRALAPAPGGRPLVRGSGRIYDLGPYRTFEAPGWGGVTDLRATVTSNGRVVLTSRRGDIGWSGADGRVGGRAMDWRGLSAFGLDGEAPGPETGPLAPAPAGGVFLADAMHDLVWYVEPPETGGNLQARVRAAIAAERAGDTEKASRIRESLAARVWPKRPREGRS